MQGIDSIFSIVARGDREGILRVIRNNQDLNEKNNIGQNLIEVAVESGLYHMAVLLRKHGANIDTKRKSDGSGLLHLACYLGHFQIVEWLVEECKLDVEAVNNMGFKPIHLCIARDRMFVAKYLIDNGALYDAEFGYSALHIAAFMGRHKIGSFLISLGVSLDRQNPQGNTPLHMACAEGEIEMIHLLLQSGADCCLFNDKNELPFQVALDGVRDVVESETARQLNRNRSSQDMVNLAIAGVFKSLPVEIAIMVFERVCRDISNSEFVTISAVLLNQNLLNHMINASDKIYSDIKANFLLDLCKSLLCP